MVGSSWRIQESLYSAPPVFSANVQPMFRGGPLPCKRGTPALMPPSFVQPPQARPQQIKPVGRFLVILSMLRRLCKGAEPMTTHPLFAAPIFPMTRRNARLPLFFLALCTLGLSLSASAQKSAFITFDPPGSIVETIPTSMNPSGAITGWYFDGNIFHGFLRSRQGAFTILDFPGATGTSGASINPAGTITGYYWAARVAH